MIDLEKIVQDLTEKEIISIVTDLGADRYERRNNYILFPTICHNLYSEQAKLKLCYYDNTKTFTCFTECGESFNIFSLIDKRFTLCGKNRVKNYKEKKDNNDYTFYDVVQYVINHSSLDIELKQEEQYHSDIDKYLKRDIPILPAYSENVLAIFDDMAPVEWLKEGITIEALQKFNIKYSISRNCAVIPHYDVDGHLIGIRERNFDEDRIDALGKYCPIKVENKIYSHQLSATLYGLNIVKDAIKRLHKVIIFEGEKSVHKMYSYLGDKSVAVASCGDHINKYQIKLLTKLFALDEIIIAFDKEYETSKELIQYIIKMKENLQRYNGYCNFSFIVDKNNLLELKDAPIDKGWEVFKQLFDERIRVNEI